MYRQAISSNILEMIYYIASVKMEISNKQATY